MRVFFIMPDGTELTAGPPAGITLRRDADAPADSLKLSFAFDFPAELEPCAARLEYNGETVFDGIVDEQAVHFEKGEKSTSFSLRSRTALLLDNEAEPGTIRMPSLRLMEQRLLRPLGLSAEGADDGPKQGELVIEKGTSCWAALCAFSERFLKVTPYETRAGKLCFAARRPETLRLPALLALDRRRLPYARISRVVVQNSQTGAYSAVIENPAAGGVRRTRYRASDAGNSPAEIFEQGERAALSVLAVCAGFVDALPGDLCSFPQLGARCAGMRLRLMRYRLTRGTEETELLFAPA